MDVSLYQEQTLDALDTQDGASRSTDPERRLIGRHKCDPPRRVRLIAKPSLQAHRALVRDFSVRGLGLLLDQPFEIGTLLAVQLQSRDVGLSGILTGKVRHATPQSDGNWLIGCSLSRPLTDDEIFTLLKGPRDPDWST
jgi:hypothetical protein